MSALRDIQGWASALAFYPLAERIERREIRHKLASLRTHYARPFAERRRAAAVQLADMVRFAGETVPYYRDMFATLGFDAVGLEDDPNRLAQLPFLTKEIIREQGERLLSAPLAGIRHHSMKTGGSTGASARIFYDQQAADHSAAVTLFARELVGKRKHMFEVHFASRFPDPPSARDARREWMKELAMNRHNIFFDRLDETGIEDIWRQLKRFDAFLVHAHPSTMYAIACHVRRRHGGGKAFEIFESSGELLEPYMRKEIASALNCKVIDRYGLAELGIVAYQGIPGTDDLLVLDSEVWPEFRPSENSAQEPEIVFTGLRNRLMPLIRYGTGDLGRLDERADGFFLSRLTGRMHDVIRINGTPYATHYVQDVLDRIGGIQEFQIDQRSSPALLRIVPEPAANIEHIAASLARWWQNGFEVRFVGHDDLVRVGWRAKFRRVVGP